MGKMIKTGIFAGLLGAGLYAAYQRLDQKQRDELKQNVIDKTSEFKDRAVDYMFYADDALTDAQEIISDKVNATKGNLQNVQDRFQSSNDETDPVDNETSVDDDIIIDAKSALETSAPQESNDDKSQDDLNSTPEEK